jgi:hypothetical protein
MALECDLVIAGATDAARVLERAWSTMPTRAPVERLDNGTLVADLFARYGFVLSVHASKRGYVQAEAGGSMWEWELAEYARMGFRFDKEFELGTSRAAMLQMVARILTTGSEDVALTLNGDVLLLRRQNGRLERFDAGGFWNTIEGQLPAALAV